MSHKAFISYSHHSDRALAPAIQSALHRFAKPWYRMRALKVFLDATSLSASAALGPSIERALADSEWFLLVASPLSAASRWVRQEVTWWLQNRSPDRMLILLSDGDLAWDPQARDFDWSRTTALPRDLAGRFADEPLYVDFRWAKEESPALSLRGGRFRAAILDIAAPLHGRAKDELDGDDVRQHRRTRRISAAALTLILVGATIAGWQAWVATLARRAAEESAEEARTQRDVANTQRGIAEQESVKAENRRKEAEQQRLEAEQQRREAERQRAEAQRQRDAALAALLRADAERLEARALLDPALLLALESARYSRAADVYDTVYRLIANRARPIYYAPEPVEFSVVSRDGRHAAVAGARRLSVIDLERSATALTIPQRVTRARFSPDARYLAVVTSAGQLEIFDVPEGRLHRTAGEAKTEVAYHPNLSEDGALVATADDRTVRITETFTGRVVFEGIHANPVAAAFPLGPDRAAIWGSGGYGVLSAAGFVAMPGERRSRLRQVSSIGAGTDWVAFKFIDPAEDIVFWNARTGESYGAAGPDAMSGAVNPRGDRIAIGYEDGTLIVRRLPDHRDVARFKFNYSVTGLKYSADGRRLVVQSSLPMGFAAVHRIDTAGWLQVGSAETVPASFMIGSNSEIVLDAEAKVVAAGRLILSFQDGVRRGWRQPPDQLEHVTVSNDWTRVAAVVGRAAVVVVDAGTGAEVATVAGCATFGPPALSADGRRLAVRCLETKQVRLYDVDTGRAIGSFEDASRTPLTFTPAGDRVAIASRILSVPALRETGRVYPGLYLAMAFAPGGRDVLLAAGGGVGPLGLHHAIAGTEQTAKTYELERGIVDSLAYSPTGAQAAAAFRGDPDIRLYRTSDWRAERISLKEEGARLLQVTRLAFSPDGRLLAAISESQRDQSFRWFVTLRVFDVGTGVEVIRAPLSQPAFAIRFAAGNSVVQVLAGQPYLEQLEFPLDVQRWVAIGCARVRGNLSPEEWKLYIPGVAYRVTCPVLNPAAGRLTTG